MKKLILDKNDLTGTIPESITDMGLLEQLHLQDNNLDGGLPDSIGALTNLRYLYVQNNNLTEPIPASIGTLSSVTRFQAHGNDITGAIPEAIGGMTSLEKLRLEGNAITGAVPDTVTSLANLTQLSLQNNFISSIPDFNNHPNPANIAINVQNNFIPQEDLDTNANLFSGGTQSELGTFTDLQVQALYDLYMGTSGDFWTSQTDGDPGSYWPRDGEWAAITTVDQASDWHGVTVVNGEVTKILLGENNLGGTLPASIGNLIALEDFQVRLNNISGPIPTTFANLINMKILKLEENQFSGGFPVAFRSMTQLTWLNAYLNQFEGPMPEWIGELTGLTHLNFGDNPIGGPLPDSIVYLENLDNLFAYRAGHTGTIPEFIGSMDHLKILALNGNQFIGDIPDTLRNLTQLKQLYLGNSGHTGSFPQWVVDLEQLEIVWIFNAGLSGELPLSWGGLNNLTRLSLFGNGLTGPIPPALGSLPNLKVLDLGINQLEGKIPADLGNSQSLEYVYLNSNLLEDSLPPELGNLTQLKEFWIDSNNLSGTFENNIVQGWDSLKYFRGWGNQFTGPLPDAFGQLPELIFLDLGINQFSGTIPSSYGSAPKLRTLAVNQNQLSGSVPPEIVNLGSIDYLWLSDNALTSFPDFSAHPTAATADIRIENNHLQFSHLEPNFNADSTNNFGFFSYSPQNQPPAETLAAIAGVPQTFDATDGTDTQYQWQVGVNGAWTDIPGATNATYTAELAADQMELHIRCAKTNTKVTGFTIYTSEYILERTAAVPDLAENMPIDSDLGPQPQNIDRPLTDNNPRTLNYVRSYAARKAGLTEAQLSITAPTLDVQASTQFIDGLGRPVQTVIRKESPAGNDIIQPIVYDAFGRNEKEYLPFTQAVTGADAGAFHYNNLQKQYDFYHATSDGIADTDSPIATTASKPLRLTVCCPKRLREKTGPWERS